MVAPCAFYGVKLHMEFCILQLEWQAASKTPFHSELQFFSVSL